MEYKKFTSMIAVTLFAAFCVFIIFYERHEHQKARAHIEKHARVIADALWNVNPKGASEYLSLACKSQNYQYVLVTDSDGKTFKKEMGEKPELSETLLGSLGLIPSVPLASKVIHNGKTIGEIEAVWDKTTIYRELWVLFVMILMFLILQLYVRILFSKQELEIMVFDRTKELSALNRSLRIKVKEHRHAREALFKSEERYRLMAENVADVIWTMDLDMKFTYISPSVYSHRGVTVQEAMNQPLSRSLHPDSYHLVKELFANTLKLAGAGDEKGFKPVRFEVKQYHKNGQTIWTSNNARILPGPDRRPESIIGVTHDITQIKKAQKKIQQLSLFRESVIDNANIWLNVLDENGNVLVWNKAAESISGYAKEEVVGHNKVWRWFYPDRSYRKKILETSNAIIEKNMVLEDFETRILRKDGETRVISWHSRRFKDDAGTSIGSISLGRDITERKQAEKEKINAQKVAADHRELALVGQIAGKMAHDFNNILGIIMGNTELSLMDCEDPKTRKTLELIVEQTLHGRNLTKNLVAFAKSQEPKQEFFDIAEKIDLVLSLLKKDLEGIEVIREDLLGVPQLLADPGMIEHTLVNLVQNAVHAMSLTQNPKLRIRTYSRDTYICFEIADNGCGIPQTYLKDIYSPSFTLKGSNDIKGAYRDGIKGTGYGMSNVKKYIQLHKGDIQAVSRLGSGTTFTICFPVIQKQLTRAEKEEIKTKAFHRGKSILLVEDETAISDVQYQVLTQDPCGHKVDIAVNGTRAKQLFEQKVYDVVSLDYVLPGDVNGMDVYAYIRKKDERIPILFVSGNIEFLESIRQLKQRDANIDHMSKPCPNREYIDNINKLLDLVTPG